jgi:hypothetical protein
MVSGVCWRNLVSAWLSNSSLMMVDYRIATVDVFVLYSDNSLVDGMINFSEYSLMIRMLSSFFSYRVAGWNVYSL